MARSAGGALGCLTLAASGPLFLLNAFGGIIAGVWLALLAEWDVIFGGLFLIVISPYVLGFILMLGRLPIIAIAGRRSQGVQRAALIIFLLYTIAVVTAFSFYVLGNALAHAGEGAGVPTLLWAYIVATSPWIFLARKDEEVQGSPSPGGISAIFAQVAFATVGVWLLVSTVAIQHAVLLFFSIMLIGEIINLILFDDLNLPTAAPDPSPEEPAATPFAPTGRSSPPPHASEGYVRAPVVITCECGQRLRVPGDRGPLRVTCSGCGETIEFDPVA